MCLDKSYRWRSADTIAWLRTRGLHSVPNSIKVDIEDLVYNGPRSKVSDNSAVLIPPPGRFVFNASGRASNDPSRPMNLLPMFRRLNWESVLG